ncbi:MAG TPA: hypothetical protein VGP02_12120 [Mycobacteriales bacterium]|jgi:hypothetical protein|nr:hypothetical protein [Mycobacteriales bacterium]
MRTVAMLRDAVSARRAERLERRRLERELATYTTPAERLELDAMIERYAPEETRRVRAIVARQRVTEAGPRLAG